MTDKEREELELYRKFLLFIWDSTDFYSLVNRDAPTLEELEEDTSEFKYLREDDRRLQEEGEALVEKVEEALSLYVSRGKQ